MTILPWYFRTHTGPGEQLETVHLQRQRAQAAYDLIDYYTQFSRDDTTRIDNLKKEGKDGRHQVAILLRRFRRGPLIDAPIDKRKYRQVL